MSMMRCHDPSAPLPGDGRCEGDPVRTGGHRRRDPRRAGRRASFCCPDHAGVTVRENWAAVVRASRRQLSFVPLDDAEAIAATSPAYEAGEIAAGQFGGSPTLPEESVTTIEVTTYLLADRDARKTRSPT